MLSIIFSSTNVLFQNSSEALATFSLPAGLAYPVQIPAGVTLQTASGMDRLHGSNQFLFPARAGFSKYHFTLLFHLPKVSFTRSMFLLWLRRPQWVSNLQPNPCRKSPNGGRLLPPSQLQSHQIPFLPTGQNHPLFQRRLSHSQRPFYPPVRRAAFHSGLQSQISHRKEMSRIHKLTSVQPPHLALSY